MYRARDEKLQRDVALKLLAPSLMADTEARRRLTREARALRGNPRFEAVRALAGKGGAA